MWFLSARKNRRVSSSRICRNAFRPRLEALEDRCLLSAGALDPTFGTSGVVTPAITPQAVVSSQLDGKTVIGGSAFSLERFNSDGSVDTGFGTNGVVTMKKFTGICQGLALQADGKIVAVGYTTGRTPQFAVARYNSNGSLDSGFGNQGIVLTTVGSGTFVSAVAIDGNGNIDVAGNAQGGFAVVRYTTSGSLDTSFNRTGIVITTTSGLTNARALGVQSDGNIVVAGKSTYGMAVARYIGTGTTAGQLDGTFGTAGIVIVPTPVGAPYPGQANSVLIQNGGYIVTVGLLSGGASSAGLAVARFNSNGTLDTSFGSQGTVVNPLFAGGGGVAAALSGNGDIIALGGGTNHFIGATAYLPNGSLDATFGNNGTTSTLGFSGSVTSLAIERDGKVLVAGSELARLQAPDSKITSFTAAPNPVAANTSVTLSASGILNSNPTTTITQVAFYLDANGDGTLEPGTDTLLGYGTNNNGVWTFTPTTSGTFTLFAQAMEDNNGGLSDPVAVTLNVM
jgi:uncharacterized delta-60 repeat protein